MPKPKIYILVNGYFGDFPGHGDVIGAAIAEDGTYLAGHLSSTRNFLRHDMGLTSDWKHDRYLEHYPDGFDLVDLIDGSHEENMKQPDFAAAIALNHKKFDEDNQPEEPNDAF